MSKAYEALRTIGIYNPHNAVSFAVKHGYDGPAIYVSYRPQQTGRAHARAAAWQVIGVGFDTDPGGHWMDNKNKSFCRWDVPGGSAAEMQFAAQEWATKEYGVDTWVKIPGLPRSLFPKPVADTVKAALKAARS